MAKKETTNSLESVLKELDKTYGKGSVINGGELESYSGVISTGSIGLDAALGIGGIPQGKIIEFQGWESCLDKDSYIKFIVVNPENGIVQDCKGQTIENLYQRFHNRSKKTKNSIFYVMGINENNAVFRNLIADVVKTGRRKCFTVKTKNGKTLTCTKEHKFYTGQDYVELGKLSVGDRVFIHNNTPFSGRKERDTYSETTIKYYYKGKQKLINGHKYFREKVHRLIYEAHMNQISYSDYITLLNSGITKLPDNFWTIPENYHIHHIDGNTQNNDISNLELIDPMSHGRLHSFENSDKLRFVVVPDEIESITPAGIKETYDIKCFYPYNNYIAEGIVVHNSGKSTIVQTIIANAQKKGIKCLYCDGENSLDEIYAKKLGIDLNNLLLIQLDSHGGEAVYNKAEKLINTGEIGLVVFDSQNSLQPKKLLEGEVGDATMGVHARMLGQAVAKMNAAAIRNNCTVIFISQLREKIGVMFGSPEVSQGGNALKFYSHVRLDFRKSVLKEDDVAYANKTKVKVIKNKCAVPFKTAEFEIVYGVGIDKIQELVELGNKTEVLKKWGGTITYGEDKYELQEFKNLLIEKEDFFNEIREKIIAKL